ncbi:MAG: hypothetical protein IPL33_22410 [Sphingobacteriales bacterium]|nr:hypothetical protein [Sphingobacteriales bacterium]
MIFVYAFVTFFNFTCYGELNPLHLSLCYFALNLMRSNFTCYEALNRPFAISRLT